MIKRTLSVVLCLLVIGAIGYAQQLNAKLFGTVVESEGAPLPGVSVEATSPKLVGKATAVTDQNGTFRFLSLMPGEYKLVFSLQGFQTLVREGIIVSLEQTITIKETLQLGKIEEQVTVIGQSPLIDVKSTAKGLTMTKEVFKNLPRGRDFSSLLITIPGVNYEPLQGNGGYSVDGASGAENVFYTDGMEVTDIRGGEQSQGVVFEMVDELQVKASGYTAEYGGSMGGVINIVTRSGGNTFHGNFVGFFSGSALNGKERDSLRLNPIDQSIVEYVNYQDLYGKTKINRYEGGLGLGGYILRDKIWFYASFIPTFRNSSRDVTFLYPEGFKASYDRKESWMNFQGKITVNLIKSLRVSLAAVNNFYKEKGDLPPRDGSGSNAFAWDKWGWGHPNYSFSGTADYTAGNDLLISAHGGYFYQGQKDGLSPTGPIYLNRRSIPAAYNMPADLWRPAAWSNWGNIIDTIDGSNAKKVEYKRASFGLDVNYFVDLMGEHSLKTGIQWGQVSDNLNTMWDQPYVRLNYGRTYSWIDATGLHKDGGQYGYYEVRAPFGDLVNNAKSNRLAVYLQDSWTIDKRLTLNFGVRAESEKVPAFADVSFYPEFQGQVPLNFKMSDKIAPRLGFIYDVFGDSNLKVFGSFGIFHDVMKLAMPEGSYGGELWESTYYKLDTLQWNTIGVGWVFPGDQLGPVLDWRYPSVEATDPDIKPMSQREISFGVEKKLTENMVISARLVNKHLLRAIEDIGFYNVEGGEEYVIGNPGFGLTKFTTEGGRWDPTWPACPKAKREYTSVNAMLEKRLSGNWMGGISYTWSSLKGNFGGLDSSDEPNRNDPNVNRYWDYWFNMRDAHMNPLDGPLPTDRTHNIKIYGTYLFPFGLTVGSTGFAYSGVPVSTQFVLNSQQGYYPESRMDTGKRTPFIYYLNLYAEYQINIGRNQLSININVDNVTDSKMARRIFEVYNRDLPYLDDTLILAGFDYKTLTAERDNRYLKNFDFYPPISTRFGIRFSF